MTIKNAKDFSVNHTGLPDMSDALGGLSQRVTFRVLSSEIVNFRKVERVQLVSCYAVIQAFTPEQLLVKAEGERSWKWFRIHATEGFNVDDRIITMGSAFRILRKTDYSIYGFYIYDAVEDYRDVDGGDDSA